jgi:Cu2+-containing amine oxidase
VVSNSEEEKYPYKIVSSKNLNSGYYIEPNHGQFGDKSHGDHATLFVTKFKANEGDKDLLTLGSCCDLQNDGVEQYIKDKESLKEKHIVLWYVPRIRNDAREGYEYCWADTVVGDDGNLEVKIWPCTVGPKFIPLAKGQK